MIDDPDELDAAFAKWWEDTKGGVFPTAEWEMVEPHVREGCLILMRLAFRNGWRQGSVEAIRKCKALVMGEPKP